MDPADLAAALDAALAQPLSMADPRLRAAFLRWRGVQTPCPRCGGTGRVHYSNGSTWRGGAGGAACTWDVCDGCWGSGDATAPGSDLRAAEKGLAARIRKSAAAQLSNRVGGYLSVMAPALAELAGELERMARGRRPRPDYYYETCGTLGRELLAMADAATAAEAARRPAVVPPLR